MVKIVIKVNIFCFMLASSSRNNYKPDLFECFLVLPSYILFLVVFLIKKQLNYPTIACLYV